MDVAKRDWSDKMLAANRARSLAYAPLGRRQFALGNGPSGGRGTPVICPAWWLQAWRRQCSQRGGDGRRQTGQAFLSLGTSGVLFVATDRFRPNPTRLHTPFVIAFPIVGIKLAVLLTAASALDWVVRLTGNSNPEETLAAAQARGLAPWGTVLPP